MLPCLFYKFEHLGILFVHLNLSVRDNTSLTNSGWINLILFISAVQPKQFDDKNLISENFIICHLIFLSDFVNTKIIFRIANEPLDIF